MIAKTYDDKAKCPQGHRFHILRRIGTAGKVVGTYCPMCKKSHRIKAGQPRMPKGSATRELNRCAAGRDGECGHAQCPQLRDNEPRTSGRHCPLDNERTEQ
ncbi:hypothetical protein [Massilia timonae]|uniref:hypothetical protein n=1 Tax=Massilia timonae TaxID=47229 RepID=UPI0028D24D90|nr:hypothetical protein [Massilia timonae]